MGDDPATSVVDRWCAAHDVPNLYVLDGAVFPTSGPMAPTSTICANSLRCTERLIERARSPADAGLAERATEGCTSATMCNSWLHVEGGTT